MADLAHYCIAEFDQTEVLSHATLAFPRAPNGADAALSLAWAQMIGDAYGNGAAYENGASPVFDQKIAGNLNGLKARVNDLIVMQDIIGESVKTLPNGGWSGADKFNMNSNITRVVLEPHRTAWYVEPTLLNYPDLWNGTFFLALQFDAGVHIIGMVYFDGLLCLFDPNIGVLVAKNADEVSKLSAALVAEYASGGMTIGQSAVYAVANA